MNRLFLVRYGEIALKGNNRNIFENMLVSNIKRLLRVELSDSYKVEKEHGRIFVHCSNEVEDTVEKVLRSVFGVVSFSKAIVTEADIDAIGKEVLNIGTGLRTKRGTFSFKIEVKRPNKKFPMQSPEICKHLGGVLLDAHPDLTVDVHHPQILMTIEIRDMAYLFTETIKGQGGMPYGSAGKGILLLSGGIDSPVAGYLIARRGLAIEAVHFHSFPYTSERAFEKVLELGRKLKPYIGNLKIHSVNLLEIQKQIAEKCPPQEMTIMARRFMMQIAEVIAQRADAKVLVTGENLGQVASQTVEGLTVTNAAVSLPVLRPLIAYDKGEIIEIAQKIDTFETSILPYEDCCTVFLPDRVLTRPKLNLMEASQLNLDSAALIERAIETMEIIEL